MIESFKLPNITPETLTGSIVSFNDEYGGLPLKSCVSQISGYQEGSGTPSPDNIRPLVGWTEANIVRCGKNLFGGEYNVLFPLVIHKGTTITVSATKIGNYPFFAIYDNDDNLLDYWSIYNERDGRYYRSITINFEVAKVKFYNNEVSNMQIELGNTATPYEPYTGNTYTFTFGQSIYQGSIDWKSGVVVGTHKIKSIDSSSQINHGEGTNVFYINNFFDTADDTETTDCNYFVRAEQNYYTIANVQTYMEDKAFACAISVNRLFIKNTDWSSLSDFLTWLGSGHIDIAIKLATPIEIPLGGINLLTRKGQNNIYCNTGNTEVKFLKVT